MGGLRKREECGVTFMFPSSWVSFPREGLLEKGQLWRRMGVNSVSGGKKGEKGAMGLWLWPMIFRLLP